MTARIFTKLLLAFAGLLVIAALGLDLLITSAAGRELRRSLETSLTESARLAALLAEQTGEAQYADLAKQIAGSRQIRVTIIRADGDVVADSELDAAAMENQAARPEFAAALNKAIGVSRRETATQGAESLYVAVPLRSGALRLAQPISDNHEYAGEVRSGILRAALLALVPMALLAAWLARRISARLSGMIGFSEELGHGNFEVQAPRFGGELGALQDSLTATSLQLRSTFEQVQQERARFEAAINGIGEGILVADRENRVILINPAMRKMFPKDPLKTGSRLGEWSHRQVQDLFAEVFQSETVRSVELTVRQPAERSWKVTCAPIAGPSRKVHAAVAVFYDITEIERVDRMRKDFVINVSHELRTPLTAIQGYTETLLDGAMDEPEHNRRFLRIIRQNSERLAQLTSDLMVLSQIEVNAREFALLPHKVLEILIQSTDAIRVLTQPKNISVSIDPIDRNLVVDCDGDAIHQVLMNLLENATKYTPEGGTITVGAQAEDTDVEFYVRDNGIGIPPEHIPRLFERFYRVDKARSRALGGTGLGLAIVKHLVIAHGGAVRVESTEGQGSTFYFRIPSRITEPEAGRAEARQKAMLT